MIFACGREYDVLYSLLYILENNLSDITFIISKDLPKLGYRKKLLNLPFVYDVIEVDDDGLHEGYFFNYKFPVIGMTLNLFLLNYKINRIYDRQLATKLGRNKNSEIYLFFCNTALKIYLYNFASEVIYLEEGQGIYNKNYPSTYLFIRKMLRLGDPYGNSAKVRRIVLSKPGGYNKTNPYKIDEFEVAHAIKNSKTQEIIRTVFNTGFYKSKTDRKIAIVLTQPLSEDGLCLESEKINFYLKVKNILEKKYEVFVKPHPRDESNYSQEFQGNLIDKKIMMELIRFEKSIDLVVSINSTAAYNVPGSKCVHQFLPHQEFTSFYSIDLESLYEL